MIKLFMFFVLSPERGRKALVAPSNVAGNQCRTNVIECTWLLVVNLSREESTISIYDNGYMCNYRLYIFGLPLDYGVVATETYPSVRR